MPIDLRRFRSRAVTRDGDEEHRVSTTLELLLDLTYVVAIARAVGVFHTELAAGLTGRAVLDLVITFWILWWSWMGFTWFANAHDGDTVTDRLLTLVQMAGALIIAAGVTRAAEGDYAIGVAGYVVARIGLVIAWLRVARDQPNERDRALRYSTGLVILQAFWVTRLFLPDGVADVTFAALVVLELAVPYWAARSTNTLSLHSGHIEERYGLFTIILLGETIAASTGAFQSAFDAGGLTTSLAVVALGGLLLAFGCWWLYFDHPGHLAPTDHTAFRWGLGHVIVFFSLATLGGGIGTVFEELGPTGTAMSTRVGSLALALPVAGFLSGLVVLMLLNGVSITSIRIWPKLVVSALMVAAGTVLAPVGTMVAVALLLCALVFWMIVDDPDPASRRT